MAMQIETHPPSGNHYEKGLNPESWRDGNTFLSWERANRLYVYQPRACNMNHEISLTREQVTELRNKLTEWLALTADEASLK